MKQKILLVGNSRICPQVAYVMGWQDFEQVEQLTNADQYRNYKIVVCAWRNKSKRLVQIKNKILKIIYLDDICRELDLESQSTSQAKILAPVKLVPLWRRVIDRMKKGEVLLAILRRHRRRYGPLKSIFWIKRMPTEQLTVSEMLIKVLFSNPTNIVCDRLVNYCTIFEDGNLYGCCTNWLPPMGSIEQAPLADVYDSKRARIIKLSMYNRSYCFCNLHKCEFYRYQIPNKQQSTLSKVAFPQYLELAIDKTCNLHCPSCRSELCTVDAGGQNKIENIIKQAKQSNWLEQVPHLVVQGTGEVFCSTSLKQLLANGLNRTQIHILSNGLLFNQENWELLKNKYQQIDVEISVDAVTADTYRKIRGGNFQQLRQNLEMLGELRRENKIRYFELNFVVQKDNYLEMADFVRLAKNLSADKVHFTHLNNWGTFSRREYQKKCLIIDNRRLDRRLRQVLRDPIFQEPEVDLVAFTQFIPNFVQRFPHNG